jgi:HEAT repeat protein
MPISAAARDATPDVRWRVAYELGKIGDRAGAPALRTLSSDKVEMVRAMAARALGDVGDSTAGARLVSLLGDSDGDVHRLAAYALATSSVSAAHRAVRSCRSLAIRTRTCAEAAATLGLVGDSTAISRLQAARQSTG